MSGRMAWVALGLTLLGSAACAQSEGALRGGGLLAIGADGHRAEAEAALEHARAAKARMQGTRGSKQRLLRARAVRAYQDVARLFPSSGEVAAEASFRAAELLRSGGDDEAALVELQRAIDTARGGAFIPRARYEAGQILRRTRRFELALERFTETETDRNADAHRRDLASLWKAKTRLEMGQPQEAERDLRALVKRAVEPVDRLRAYDELILILARSGRLAAAVGHLAEAKRSVWHVSLQQTALGEDVRDCLSSLRSLDVLSQEIDRARLAAQKNWR